MSSKINVSSTDVVAEGNCLILTKGNVLAYAGPIKGSPQIEHSSVLLNPVDFYKLKDQVENKPQGRLN
jgi:hypothetical protein